MTNRAFPIVTILLLAVAGLAFAQTPAMIVEYYENTSGAMYVRTADGAEYDADQFGFGEELPPGATLVTLDGDYAELRLEPNGTIIRVGENTNFRVDSLQGLQDGRRDDGAAVRHPISNGKIGQPGKELAKSCPSSASCPGRQISIQTPC